MEVELKKNLVGRPKTGRKLARYWLKESAIAIISERGRRKGFKRPADYLESVFAQQ